MRFEPSNCQMFSQDCISIKPSFLFAVDQLDEVGRYGYFGSCISPIVHASDEVCSGVQIV